MPFTGSEVDLKARLMAELEPLLPNDETKEVALERLEKIADALSKAIVSWLLANGSQSIQGTVIGQGTGQGVGANAGGPVTTVVSTTVQGTVDPTSVKLV